MSKLRLKIFGGPSTGEVFYFSEKDCKITLGRKEDCEVYIEDALLSKQQATIEVSKEGWVMRDGIEGK